MFELPIEDAKSRAAAVLLRDEGLRLVGEIAALIGLKPEGSGAAAAEAEAVCRRLSAAVYRLKEERSWSSVQSMRAASRPLPSISARPQHPFYRRVVGGHI